MTAFKAFFAVIVPYFGPMTAAWGGDAVAGAIMPEEGIPSGGTPFRAFALHSGPSHAFKHGLGFAFGRAFPLGPAPYPRAGVHKPSGGYPFFSSLATLMLCAAVLTENGFMDSEVSLRFLESKAWKKAIVVLYGGNCGVVKQRESIII